MNTQPDYFPQLMVVARHNCDAGKAALYADGSAAVWGRVGFLNYRFVGFIKKISKREFHESSFEDFLERLA
jgi:hypothetical protein